MIREKFLQYKRGLTGYFHPSQKTTSLDLIREGSYAVLHCGRHVGNSRGSSSREARNIQSRAEQIRVQHREATAASSGRRSPLLLRWLL
uniref:Uncharacterized protein n=1 Tax=Arundo donax TaxID=35708 RepID=A0A0A9CER3_ARUDO